MAPAALRAAGTRRARALALALLLLAAPAAPAPAGPVVEPATGIAFDDRLDDGLTLLGVGCRRKGPLKVYAVGLYGDDAVRARLADLPADGGGGGGGGGGGTALRDAAGAGATALLLKMHLKVGAAKMGAALEEGTAARLTTTDGDGGAAAAGRLGALVSDGVGRECAGGAAVPGTTLRFACGGGAGTGDGAVAVAVDGRAAGTVDDASSVGAGVGPALRGLFLDGDGVAPTLRASVAARCCGRRRDGDATSTTTTTTTTTATATASAHDEPAPGRRRRRRGDVATLPALPYPEDALAPVLGAAAVRASYRRHHAG